MEYKLVETVNEENLNRLIEWSKVDFDDLMAGIGKENA